MSNFPKSRTRRSPYRRLERPFRWSDNKRQLLDFVGAFRFLTDKECFAYWGADRERHIEKWLSSLFDAGYLDRVRVGLNEPIPHHLTPQGAAYSGFKVPKYIPRTVRDHEFFIAFIGMGVAKLLGTCRYPKHPITYLKPDALLDCNGYRILIEADCHSENEDQWRTKLDNYRMAIELGRLGVDLAQVRVVVGIGYKREGYENEKRLQELLGWTADYANAHLPNMKNLFYFVTEQELYLNSFQVPEFKSRLPLIPSV